MAGHPEKHPLLITAAGPQPSRQTAILLRLLAVAFLLRLALFLGFASWDPAKWARAGRGRSGEVGACPQVDPLAPASGPLDANRDVIFGADYRTTSAKVHGGLVQIRSESFDDNGAVSGDDADPRWNVFYDVAHFLNTTFPLVHEHLTLEKVNKHGLVFTWQGSDASLKPTMLMAHQDTVPVNPATLDLWTHPPWSGYYDGSYLWGRGSADCKNTLSGILEAVTFLLEGGFQPRRTLLLAFGFDEESKGLKGAGEIAKFLEARYGKDGIAFIVDEGGLGVGELYGANMALPALGEKGYMDVNFTLHTPGGHSSIPPDHSGIGIISTIVNALEAHPFDPTLPLTSPIYSLLSCAADYGKIPPSLKRSVKRGLAHGRKGEKARQHVADEFAALGRLQRYLVSTSQAVDVVAGGVKVNALPELSYVVVNYRIDVNSEPQAIKHHISKIVSPIAEQFQLEVDLFGSKHSFRQGNGLESGGSLQVESIKLTRPEWSSDLFPAPVSPVDSPAWDVFSGTIKHAFGPRFGSSSELIVAPAIMTGNTDTRYMWNLSRNIYRFSPMDRGKLHGLHTVDEAIWFDDHISGIWFFHELIRSADEAEL
ncbi:hypothetical protein JCM21900_000857 [Sporobolomyces salmonicolor]